MKKLFGLSLLWITILPSAHAANLFGSGAFYLGYSSTKQGSVSSSDLQTFANLTGAYTFAKNIYFGGKYVFHRETPSFTGTTAPTTTFASFGAGLGYLHADKINVMASYLLFPTHTTAGTFSNTLFGGSGYALEAAYWFKVGSSLSVGPQVSLFLVDYKKERTDSDTLTLAETRSDMWLQPYVAFTFSF